MLNQFVGYSQSVDFRLTTEQKARHPNAPNPWNIASLIILISSLLLWSISLNQIDLRQMDDIGLISVLPVSVLLALALVNLSFCLAISQQPLNLPLVLLHIAALIFMLYGITALTQEVPRFGIGWKLAGIIDYIMQTGTVDGRIDAFFNWPTVFILMAFVTEISGQHSALSFMSWAPVFFNVLYLAPLWMIYRSATSDKRLMMLGLWFFYLANWIGQDYLSPQAFAYFFFLVVLAITLTWLRGKAWQPEVLFAGVRRRTPWFDRTYERVERLLKGKERRVAPSTPAQRAASIIVLVLIFIAMVSGHQLTPFATLAALAALVFFNRCTALTLPLLLALLIATWVLYVAMPFLSGHIDYVAGPVGSIGTNLDANLTDRFSGSPGHIFINYTRTWMSLAVWILALVGGLRRFRNGYRDWGLVLAAITPFPLLLLQSYGGELLLRIYLYSVPFMVFFGAALFFPTLSLGKRWYSTAGLFIVSLMLIAGFLFTRYGNERMTYFTANEVAAVRFVYKTAEPGSQLIAATGTLPWRFQDYQTYGYTVINRLARTSDISGVAGVMSDPRYPVSYLILTRSEQAAGELFIGWPPGTWQQFEDALRRSDKFVRIYANEDAEVYILAKVCPLLKEKEPACNAAQP